MLKKTVYINCDFMPPTAERLCLVPDAVIKKGYEALCLRIVDNYPWSFDCRMRADTSYDEKVVDYIAKRCKAVGLDLLIVFPGENDFYRILKLNGYKRMAVQGERFLRIDTSSVGFRSLIEKVSDDVVSVCPELSFFTLISCEAGYGYDSDVGKMLDDYGYKHRLIDKREEFVTVNRFLDGVDSDPDNAYKRIKDIKNIFSGAVFELNRFITMSMLGGSTPAVDNISINEKYSEISGFLKEIEIAVDELKIVSSGKLNDEWLSLYCRSVLLTAEAELNAVHQRFSLSGLLN